jgi:hypothetical protein
VTCYVHNDDERLSAFLSDDIYVHNVCVLGSKWGFKLLSHATGERMSFMFLDFFKCVLVPYFAQIGTAHTMFKHCDLYSESFF